MSADASRDALAAAIGRVAQGDRAALDDIYRATNRKLFGICLRILEDRKEAEDALQEVYVNLWRNAARFDADRASPISWLAVMARNRAVDRLRVGKVRAGAVPQDAAASVPDAAPLADTMLVEGEERTRIHQCIAALEKSSRDAIVRAFFEGRTYAALAQEEAMPLSTMKSRIRRALAKLKTCLEGPDD